VDLSSEQRHPELTGLPKLPWKQSRPWHALKRGRNKDHWLRAERAWYVTDGKSAKPLCNEQGNHIKSEDGKEEATKTHPRA
jgi:hypothetical protein